MKHSWKKTDTLGDRFDARHTKRPDGCWEWTGYRTSGGYGRLSFEGRTRRAHRVSWELHHGKEFPKGKIACHTCDRPWCVNPEHVWTGTPADNMADRDSKRRTANGPKISNTVKLTESQVREIRGIPGRLNYSAIGRRYGISDVQVKNIVTRHSWKHV